MLTQYNSRLSKNHSRFTMFTNPDTTLSKSGQASVSRESRTKTSQDVKWDSLKTRSDRCNRGLPVLVRPSIIPSERRHCAPTKKKKKKEEKRENCRQLIIAKKKTKLPQKFLFGFHQGKLTNFVMLNLSLIKLTKRNASLKISYRFVRKTNYRKKSKEKYININKIEENISYIFILK